MTLQGASSRAARGILGALGFLIPLTLAILFLVLDKLSQIIARLASRAHLALRDEAGKEGVRIVFGILALLGLAAASWLLFGSAVLAFAFLGLLAVCLVALGGQA